MVKQYCPCCRKKNSTARHHKLTVCKECGYSLGSKDLEVSVKIGDPLDKGLSGFLIE